MILVFSQGLWEASLLSRSLTRRHKRDHISSPATRLTALHLSLLPPFGNLAMENSPRGCLQAELRNDLYNLALQPVDSGQLRIHRCCDRVLKICNYNDLEWQERAQSCLISPPSISALDTGRVQPA